jgi:hypothetical protein
VEIAPLESAFPLCTGDPSTHKLTGIEDVKLNPVIVID